MKKEIMKQITLCIKNVYGMFNSTKDEFSDYVMLPIQLIDTVK